MIFAFEEEHLKKILTNVKAMGRKIKFEPKDDFFNLVEKIWLG